MNPDLLQPGSVVLGKSFAYTMSLQGAGQDGLYRSIVF